MGLEELRILFSFISATGLLPHSICLNEKTLRFSCFDAGWRYATTWWFGIAGLAELSWNSQLFFFNLRDQTKSIESIIYLAVICVWETSYLCVRLTPLFLVFHARQLKNVWEVFGKIDIALKNAPKQKTSTVKQRVVIGFFIGSLMTLGINLCAIPFSMKIRQQSGNYIWIFAQCIETFVKIQLFIWFLILHLNYYGISYRLSNLRYILSEIPLSANQTEFKTTSRTTFSNSPKKSIKGQQFQRVGYLINKLAKAFHQLQSIYSIPTFIILCASFLACTISLFISIQELLQPTSFNETVYLQLLMVAIYIFLSLTVIISVDLPSLEVKRLKEHVLRLSTEMHDFQDSVEYDMLQKSLSNDRFQLSVGGLFTVNKKLILTLTGTVLTYLVILLQNVFVKN